MTRVGSSDVQAKVVLTRRVQTIEESTLRDYRCLLGEWLRRNVFRLSRRSVELGRLLLWFAV